MPVHHGKWPEGTPAWVYCRVDDTAAARGFYGTLFGWQIVDLPPAAGGYLMALRDGNPAAGIGVRPGSIGLPASWTSVFATADAAGLARKVTAAGGSVIAPPWDVLDVGRMVIIADPYGAMFGVWEARTDEGFGVYSEHASHCWDELHSGRDTTVAEFYRGVFGWRFLAPGTDPVAQRHFAVADGEQAVGGIVEVDGAAQQPFWRTWFRHDDLDELLIAALDLGARVVLSPSDGPHGRRAVLEGPQGEVFGVIELRGDLAAAAG